MPGLESLDSLEGPTPAPDTARNGDAADRFERVGCACEKAALPRAAASVDRVTNGRLTALDAVASLPSISATGRACVAILVEKDVAVTMRDGVALATDVYRPDAEGQFPVILVRTPYNKNDPFLTNVVMFDPVRAAAAGYVVCVQDCRGRYSSEGKFHPIHQEIDDGYDAVEWCARQPWSTGKVGMAGASYVGATQLLAAIASPPHLVAIAPNITASNYHEGWFYQGGAFELGFTTSWVVNFLAIDTLLKQQPEQIGAIIQAADELDKVFRQLPLKEIEPIKHIDYFQEWLEHASYDDYWSRCNIESHYQNIKAAALNIGGWYDIFLYGTVRNFLGLRSQGGSDAARSSRLLVGPWAHITRSLLWMGNLVGDVNFGIQASSQALDLMGVQLRWFDYWLKGTDNGLDREAPVRLFVTGRNSWLEATDFPPPGAKELRFFLHSGGGANGRTGDGRLSLSEPGDEPADRFVYDPMNPVPTRGGGLCCSDIYLPGGAFDQRDIEDRPDVLVFTSEPLASALEVIGAVKAKLFVATSAPDTDFTAKLVDVYPDGRAINICDGILRLRYRHGADREELAQPGHVYEIEIDLWYAAHVFQPGHRVRLEVSSSNFPRFDRNLNTGRPCATDREAQVAVQHLFHDAARPSALVLTAFPFSG